MITFGSKNYTNRPIRYTDALLDELDKFRWKDIEG